MKQSISFSENDTEHLSLNFSELRDLGIKYIQELSGEVWTDYNSHDPGVTILEQLCYALTDIANRTSLPIEDLLTIGKDVPLNAHNNAFIAPSSILSSHPVTIKDTRKMIIDQFEEIQNVWMTVKEGIGYEEQLTGINKIEILPKLIFLNTINSDSSKKETFLNNVNKFLNENRNLGEKFGDVILLEPQFITIEFNIHLNEDADVEKTIAKLFLKLLEFIYCPIQYRSYGEMKDAGYGMEEIFSGPKLNRGFVKDEVFRNRLNYTQINVDIKDEINKNRLKTIHVSEVQKTLSKVNGISNCEVKSFNYNGVKSDFLEADNNKFFHLLEYDYTNDLIDDRFDSIYENMKVFVNNKALPVFNKQKVIGLFLESWSKKHRGYPIGDSKKEQFFNKLTGTWRNPEEYHSIQRHFPMIYGIGKEGISKNEPEERHAKAKQLKAYLMLFEQHFANHLAQLGNLNEFFNIEFNHEEKKRSTYFTQWMDSVPGIDKLVNGNTEDIHAYLETNSIFFDRKNRIYNHLLARFGEDINDLPWKISKRVHLIRNEDEYNRILLQKKSQFLIQLEKLTYYRTRGEYFHQEKDEKGDLKYARTPSGLEEIILAKTGIQARKGKSGIRDFLELNIEVSRQKEDHPVTQNELNDNYRTIRPGEIDLSSQLSDNGILPNTSFGKIGLKALFKETLNYNNYRISKDQLKDKTHVIFKKERDKWVRLFECDTEEEAIQNICQIMTFFNVQNQKSESIYLVDHILLSDFLMDSAYGFSFIDEQGIPLFQTIDEESWCTSEEDRYNNINNFYTFAKQSSSYNFRKGNCVIKDGEGKILATCKTGELNPINSSEEFNELYENTKSFIRLFNNPENESGRMRLREVEKIRLKGSMDNKNYGQRRLVFQRKLSSGEIIDEDFFNLNISVILPDWPARFQDQQFKSYITDLIHERIPAHINNEIFWVNANEMKEFEDKYDTWVDLKSVSTGNAIPSNDLMNAAFGLYGKIMKLKMNRNN